MKVVSTLFFVLVTCSLMAQQYIDHKTDASLSYGISRGMGNAWTKRGDYSAPSLLNNFRTGSNISLSLSHKVKRTLKTAVNLSVSKFTNWNYTDYDDRYEGANLSIAAINVQAGISTAFRQNGFWNRVNLSAFAGPSLSLNILRLRKEVYSNVNTGDSDLKNSTIASPGFTVSFVSRVHVSHRATVGLSYVIDFSKVSSVHFDDQRFMAGSINIHAGWKLQHNKLFKYKSQWFD